MAVRNGIEWMVATMCAPKKLSILGRADPSITRRNEVLQVIRDCDGITSGRLCRELGMADGQLRRYLRLLVDGGQAYFDGRVWRADE